jgi:integrase
MRSSVPGLDNVRLFVTRNCNETGMSAHLKLVAPTAEKRTIATPRRRPNKELRTREYLIKDEVERLMAAARKNREGARDATMILLAYRHGLRASELTDLR